MHINFEENQNPASVEIRSTVEMKDKISRTNSSIYRNSGQANEQNMKLMEQNKQGPPASYDVEPLIGGHSNNACWKTPPRYSIPKSASSRFG